MSKPMKGVISNWSVIGNRVRGTCEFHTTYENGIELGQDITTSPIVQVSQRNRFVLVETENSLYVLV